MNDLVAFLRARLDEDEATARQAMTALESGWPDYQTYDGPDLDAATDYLDRFPPARVLREVEAKRAIAGLHHQAERAPNWCAECDEEWFPCPTLRHLATVYRDHPDYRQEWRP